MPVALNMTQRKAGRARICDVAARQGRERGFDKVSMHSIAHELGCSATALYGYFKNKETILASLRVAALEDLIGYLDRVVRGRGDTVSLLKHLGDAYCGYASDNQAAFEFIFSCKQTNGGEFPELQAAYSRLRGCWVAAARGALVAETDEFEDIGCTAWAGVHGLVMLHLNGQLSCGTALVLKQTSDAFISRLIASGGS